MKRATVLLASLSPLALLVALLGAGQTDGKTVFHEKKCTDCHSVGSEGIAATNKWPLASMIDWTRRCDYCTADLSTIGERRNAKWLKAYLKGKERAQNGLKHNMIGFTNDRRIVWEVKPPDFATFTDEEEHSLDALVAWLASLKKQKE